MLPILSLFLFITAIYAYTPTFTTIHAPNSTTNLPPTVKVPTKRIKGDEASLPRSATFTKSPVVSNGNIAASAASPTTKTGNREKIPQMTLTDMVPPPYPGTARGRLKRTPKTAPKKGLTAANSDDVLNGNDAISYEVSYQLMIWFFVRDYINNHEL